MSTLEKAISWLERSPMQRMSLGSRELFHSNFLAWLFEKYPAALARVFDLPDRNYEVSREEKYLDLVVHDGGTPVLIVENKVKSYPDLGQLQNYSKKFPEVEKRYLLTLLKPSFDPEQLGWETISYADLAAKLRRWFKTAQVEPEHRQYIQYINEYMTLIEHLATVAQECFVPAKIEENGFWFKGNRPNDLEKTGLDKTFTKFQAMAFMGFLKQADPAATDSETFPPLISDHDPAPKGRFVKVWWGLFNSVPCVTLVPTLADPDSEGLRLEIQIQGHQYRRLIAGPPLRDAVSHSKQKTEKSENTWACLEAFGADRWLLGRERTIAPNRKPYFMLDGAMMRTKMNGTFCFYKPDAVYQYIEIAQENDPEALSLETLLSQISRDIELAFDLLEQFQNTKNS